MHKLTATEHLRELLDERGVKHTGPAKWLTYWKDTNGHVWSASEMSTGLLSVSTAGVGCLTPEQAVAATLGRESWVNPTWERWHKSLRHDEIKSIGDAVEQLMYEAIEFGGDMGPNGNTYNGIDEGDVLTAGFINEWVARFEATLGSGTCHDIALEGEWFECSECRTVKQLIHPKYCPNCGAKVVDG